MTEPKIKSEVVFTRLDQDTAEAVRRVASISERTPSSIVRLCVKKVLPLLEQEARKIDAN